MNRIQHVKKLNQTELDKNVPFSSSWHQQYNGRAWVYVGGFSQRLTEGDVLCVMSQWGEIEDIHLVRDDETGRSKGFAFIKYEDWRSTALAVDNMNGAEVLGRQLSVDHKWEYQPPREKKDKTTGQQAPLPEAQPGFVYADAAVKGSASLQQGHDVYGTAAAAASGGRHIQHAAAAAAPGARSWKADEAERQETRAALRALQSSGQPLYGGAAAAAAAAPLDEDEAWEASLMAGLGDEGGAGGATRSKKHTHSKKSKKHKKHKSSRGSSSRHGDERSSRHGDERSSRHGDERSSRHGDERSSRHGDERSSRHGDERSSRHGDERSSRHGDERSSRHGDERSSRHGDERSSRHGDERSSRHGDERSSRHGDERSSRHGDERSSGHGDERSSRHGDERSSRQQHRHRSRSPPRRTHTSRPDSRSAPLTGAPGGGKGQSRGRGERTAGAAPAGVPSWKGRMAK